ncbi:MAG: hypothetical protein MJB14_15465, partial [Spirochaetes bacterium]|nr:hypothetical protein [Spirochaetota bacterium]
YLIGSTKGYWYEERFITAGLNLDQGKTDEAGLKKIVAGHLDLMPLNELYGWYLIKKMYPGRESEFKMSSTEIDQSSLKLMVSKSYPDSKNILEKFNESLKILKQNGTINEIRLKYGIKE